MGIYSALALAALTFTLFLVQPAEGASFLATGAMPDTHVNHTATLLPNGKVLVAGGGGIGGTNAALYDPATGTWMATGAMNTGRYNHTATLLPNGKVLVAGGSGISGDVVSSAELYDPATGTWMTTGAMNTARCYHTATLLPDGKVLIAGGEDPNIGGGGPPVKSAELYDPKTGTWSATGSLNIERPSGHTATLLPNGKVLVAGAFNYYSPSVTELYDPATATWTTNGLMNAARGFHTATLLPNGTVLVAGGWSSQGPDTYSLGVTELYFPATGTWVTNGVMNTPRVWHTATLLPNGKVLVAGGHNLSSGILTSAELYDPATGTWSATSSLNIPLYQHTATLLPNGQVLIAGGSTGPPTTSAELYDSAVNPSTGTWITSGSMANARDAHTATLLPDGNVLVAGGSTPDADSSAELYNSVSGTWRSTGRLNDARYDHTATLLPGGNVLVVGGYNPIPVNYLASAELYDFQSETWTLTGELKIARNSHTATLLPNGKVLIAGGRNATIGLSSAELYDLASETWIATGSLNTARAGHTATLLPNGKVLVAGGQSNTVLLSSAELYDPATGMWTVTGAMNTSHQSHTATLLPNGKVLVAGGYGNSGAATNCAELYDPTTGTWMLTGGMNIARVSHSATLLQDGIVLVAGGNNGTTDTASAELYSPASETWILTGTMNTPRQDHTATLLANGMVLVAAGDISTGGILSSAELYDVGLGSSAAWQPQIATVTSPFHLGGSLMLTGFRFRGISEGSGGNSSQDSPSDIPVVQLRSIESGQTVFLLTTNWSTNSFTSLPVWNFPAGYALATMFVNGIQSTSSVVSISVPVPISTTLTNPQNLTNGFQFAFTNNVGALFGVLTTTNLSLPLTNWTALGGVAEISPGQFQFTDPQATNGGLRFYRAYSP